MKLVNTMLLILTGLMAKTMQIQLFNKPDLFLLLEGTICHIIALL